MVRSILSIVTGYAAMAVLVMAGFAVSLLTPNFAFEGQGSVQVTNGWLIWALVAAAVGGFVCARIARTWWPVLVLAGLVFVFGSVSAYEN